MAGYDTFYGRSESSPVPAVIVGYVRQALAAEAPKVYWQTRQTNRTAMQLCDKVAERSGFIVYRKQF